VLYFTANPNGEAEVITITLSPGSKARIKVLDFYFEELEIKSRGAQGNQVTKYPVKSIKFKEKGRSTLSGQKIWFDSAIGRLNKDGSGVFLGSFEENDRIITFYKDGNYELTDYELTNRFDTENLLLIDKFHPEKVVTAVYFDSKTGVFNAKRFLIESQTLKNKYLFIREGAENYLQFVTTKQEPVVILRSGKKKSEMVEQEIALHETVDVTGWKTVGTRIADADLKEVALVSEQQDGEGESTAPTLF
jgi:topoisomerase IV subunit A